MNRINKCNRCSSEKISYMKWVYCKQDVEIDADEHITYGEPHYSREKYSTYGGGFICRNCDTFLSCGDWLVFTEKDLLKYLKMTAEE